MTNFSPIIAAFVQFLIDGKESNFRFSILDHHDGSVVRETPYLLQSIIQNSKLSREMQLELFMLDVEAHAKQNTGDKFVMESIIDIEYFLKDNSLISGMSYVILNEIVHNKSCYEVSELRFMDHWI